MVVYQLKMKKQSQALKKIQVNLRSEFSFNVPGFKFFVAIKY